MENSEIVVIKPKFNESVGQPIDGYGEDVPDTGNLEIQKKRESLIILLNNAKINFIDMGETIKITTPEDNRKKILELLSEYEIKEEKSEK